MVIHPPTLFLGFAATAIPFAYAVGGMITGRVREWVKPVFPWTLFGILILGTGVFYGRSSGSSLIFKLQQMELEC